MKRLLTSFTAGLLLFGFSACSDDEGDVPQETGFQGEIESTTAFGGGGEDVARKVIQTSDGGLALFGFTSSIDGDVTDKTEAERDYWLVKLAADGSQQWNKTYGGSGDDRGRDIIQTKDGGFALVGYSKSADGDGSNNEGQHDNWIIKTDADGNIEWEQSYGFAGHDHAYGVVQMDDGGFAMGGFLDVTASGGDGSTRFQILHGVGEYWVHRLNADGTIKWRKYFGGTNNDRIHAILKANDGGLVLVGFTESDDFDITQSNGAYEFWIIKVDADGNMLWQETFGGSEIDIAYAATNSADNAYIIVGTTVSNDGDVSTNQGGTDAWVIKVDDTGKLIWESTFGGTGFDAAHGITPASDGGYWVTGNSKSIDGDVTDNQGENDIWLLKLDEAGTLKWQKTFGGSNIDFGYDVVETTAGKVIIAGDTQSTDGDVTGNKGVKDAWMVQVR